MAEDMASDNCHDKQIIHLIRSPLQKEENLAINCIHKKYGDMIRGYLKKIGATEMDLIENSLNDALVIFFDHVRTGRYEYQGNKISSYLIKIAENKFLSEQREDLKRRKQEKEFKKTTDTPSPVVDKEKMANLIKQLLPICQDLLIAHYYNNIPLITYAEIRRKNYASIRQHHRRCIKKLRKLYLELKESN